MALPLAADAADQASSTLEVLAVASEAVHPEVAAAVLVALVAEALAAAAQAAVGNFNFIKCEVNYKVIGKFIYPNTISK